MSNQKPNQNVQSKLMNNICTIVILLLIESTHLKEIIQFQAFSTECQRFTQKQENYIQIKEITIIDKSRFQAASGDGQQHYSSYNSDENVDQIIILHSMLIQYLLVKLCPLDFVVGYQLRAVLSMQYPMSQGKESKIVRNVSFLPENNKCFYYEIPPSDSLVKFEGIFKLQLLAQCSNSLKYATRNIIKLSLSYQIFDRIQWKKSTQVTLILILLAVSGARLIYSLLKQAFSYHQNPVNRKDQQASYSITHFDVIMPAEISLIQCFDDERECLICLQPIQNTEIRITPCNHSFHRDCIDKWGKKKLSCPTCRQSLKHQLI